MSSDQRFGDLGVVDEKQLKLLMRDWRRGRADRNIWQALSDGYVMVFSIVLIGAMIISSIVQAQQDVAGCTAEGCLAARSLLPWASVAGILAFTLVISRMFGPVVASAAEGFWLMDGPTDRRRLLARRLVAAIALAFGAGVLFGALIAALTGSPLPATPIRSTNRSLSAARISQRSGTHSSGRPLVFWPKTPVALTPKKAQTSLWKRFSSASARPNANC